MCNKRKPIIALIWPKFSSRHFHYCNEAAVSNLPTFEAQLRMSEATEMSSPADAIKYTQ